MSPFLQVLFLLLTLVAGLFLTIPKLLSGVTSLPLWPGINLTLGRTVGVLVSVASIILLYQTLT